MQQFCKKLADATWFQNLITAVILFAGVLVGFETYPSIVEEYETPLHILNEIVLWIFVLEVVVKMGAEGARFYRYFKDPWNVFDFVIVAACFLPFGGSAVTVLRLLRLLRVLKLVKALPKLQILVGALLKSIPSMVYVSVLLFMLFYVYAVAAVFFFADNDPVHFENLQISMLSLFRIVTLEDWTDVMYINMYGCENYGYDENSVRLCQYSDDNPSNMSPVAGALFFVSFVLSGTMIILNLFIGVIMTGMDEAQAEAAEEEEIAERLAREDQPKLHEELQDLHGELEDLHKTLAKLSKIAARQHQESVEQPDAES
jgi:voltage-gated sodium channel